MVPNCEGCKYELEEAERLVKLGYHVATAKGREFSGKGHYDVLIVDDEGNIIAC